MATLLLKFAIPLARYGLDSAQHPGPVFHRWLPDGQKDSITLTDKESTLELWFEREGFIEDGWVRFERGRLEVDLEIMSRQASLEAGALRGLLKVESVPEASLTAMRENLRGEPGYEEIGKRLLKILEPKLSRFLDILRTNYGQFWIHGLVEWDSRRRSLCQQCNLLNMQWSLDEGTTWSPFIPNALENATIDLILSPPRYAELMTEQDWSDLQEAFSSGYQPTVAAEILSRAHELLDQGAIKYALIEGVTALEVAVSDFIRAKFGDRLERPREQFLNLPAPAKAVATLSLHGKVGLEDLETVVGVIGMRNKVVHDGMEPPGDAADQIRILLKSVATLLAGPAFKFPVVIKGNMLFPPEGPGVNFSSDSIANG